MDYNRLDDKDERNKKFKIIADRSLVDPGVKEGRILSSPYQPFPALLISNYKSTKGIICGSLSQDYFYHNFEVGHEDGKAYLRIFSSFKSIEKRKISPGETVFDEFFIGETDHADDINKIFDNYNVVLREFLKNNCGSGLTNRHTLIWDSWNDGIFRDVSEKMLIEEAKAVKKFFPNVEWFQLDDGYSSYCEKDVTFDAQGLGVAYAGENGIDQEKFPYGLKSYTEKIKALGLKPAIWIGGFCPVKSKIYKEHPEWFIDYMFRLDWAQPLDVSQKEVREYMCRAIDFLVKESGFEGIKHDFWSYAFEERHYFLINHDKSGYEYRKWWATEMRARLPDYGYLQACCDIGSGNPFLGEYFNNYRFGDDICSGSWTSIETTVFWGVAALTTHTGDLIVPNSDSIAILSTLNDDDFMFIVNFQIISRSIAEIAGQFSKVEENNKRLKILQRATKYLNNGENVYFAKYDYRKKGKNLPRIIYINSAFDAPDNNFITVGVFNGTDRTETISFSNRDVGLSEGIHITEYIWQNKKEEKDTYIFELRPHQSLLFKIEKKCILKGNKKIQ